MNPQHERQEPIMVGRMPGWQVDRDGLARGALSQTPLYEAHAYLYSRGASKMADAVTKHGFTCESVDGCRLIASIAHDDRARLEAALVALGEIKGPHRQVETLDLVEFESHVFVKVEPQKRNLVGVAAAGSHFRESRRSRTMRDGREFLILTAESDNYEALELATRSVGAALCASGLQPDRMRIEQMLFDKLVSRPSCALNRVRLERRMLDEIRPAHRSVEGLLSRLS